MRIMPLKRIKPDFKRRGFTLVELAIVVTIIGLLIGAVVKGQEMIQQANVTSTIAQIRAIRAANKTFYDMYKAMPGDMDDAETRLSGCTSSIHCRNGDGNSLIGATTGQPWEDVDSGIDSENTQFWKHLALAKLVKGIDPTAATPKWDDTHPLSALGSGFHARSNYAGDATNPGSNTTWLPIMGNILLMRKTINGATSGVGFAAISPRDASILDRKMDDGIALEGTVEAVSQGIIDGCGGRGAAGNGPMGYAETRIDYTCDLMIRLD